MMSVRQRAHVRRVWVLAAAALACALLAHAQARATGTPTARALPRLGHAWAPRQIGYGSIRPAEIFSGGDSSGVVAHIRWTSWGSGKAVGRGTALYETPAGNASHEAEARVVAFRLGWCRGYSSYNAVEWYFPQYGQTFRDNAYISDCVGAFVEPPVRSYDCRNVMAAGGQLVATSVVAFDWSCAAGRALIASTTAGEDAIPGHVFVSEAFTCNTAALGSRMVTVYCQRGNSSVGFTVASATRPRTTLTTGSTS